MLGVNWSSLHGSLKMSRRCVAKTCFNSPACKPTLKFFCFPKDEEMCHMWAEKCGRPDLLTLPPERLAKVRLCADHFETRWFLNPQYKTAFIRSAQPIPTIFHNNLHDYIPDSLKKNFVPTYCDSPSTSESKATEESDALAEKFMTDEVILHCEQNESEESASMGCHKMCRLCACLVQEAKLIDIFSSQKTDVLYKINQFLDNKISMGDGLPHYICELCIEKLNYCDETISSFIAADKKLRDLFLVKTAERQHLVEYTEGLNECENQNGGNDAKLPLTGDFDCIHTEGSEENEPSPAVGSCKKVYMIRKKNVASVLEPTHISENDFDDGAFEVLSKDDLDCEVLEECLSPSVNDSESYLNSDLVQFVSVHLQQDNFLINSTSNDENLSATATENTELMKVYQCSKCNENFPNKSKLLFHEISNHLVEASVKFENNQNSLKSVKVNANLVNNVLPKKYKRERVTCKQCGQEFIGQRPLKRHVHECHIPTDNVCLYCGAHYSVKNQLISHLRLHTNEKPYSCLLCDAKFHFKKELRRHKHIHVKSQIMACNICNKVFKSNHSLWRHKRIHSQNRCVLCYLCGKVLCNAQSLKVHLRTHSSERPCTCNSCGKKFKDSMSLSKHVIMHSTEKNFTCDICNRGFYSRALVKQHKLSHSGVKPHKCEVCGSCFNRLGNLNQHKKRHVYKEEHEKSNLNMLYECSVCGKKMKSELTLKYHIAKHTGEKKPFDCESCGKRFVAIEPYRVHMRIHTGERPYVCEVCNKSFRSLYTLKQHMGLHRDEFPYPCPFCDRRFKRLQSLIVHKRTHTGEKPHVCPMCGRCFAQKGDMLKHTKTHTRDNLPLPNKDHRDELVLEIDHIPDFALSDAEITNEFLINMPIVEVQTEIQ